HRQGGADSVPALQPARGHHPGAGALPCAGETSRTCAEEAEGSPDGGQPVRPRRQGPRQRGEASRPSRIGGQALMRFIAWWNGLGRQKRTGWLIIFISVGYIVWFLKARLFEVGPEISRKEWLYFILMLGLV